MLRAAKLKHSSLCYTIIFDQVASLKIVSRHAVPNLARIVAA